MACELVFDINDVSYGLRTLIICVLPAVVSLIILIFRRRLSASIVRVGLASGIAGSILISVFSFLMNEGTSSIRGAADIKTVEGEIEDHSIGGRNGSQESFRVKGVLFSYNRDHNTRYYFPVREEGAQQPRFVKISYVTLAEPVNYNTNAIVRLEACQ